MTVADIDDDVVVSGDRLNDDVDGQGADVTAAGLVVFDIVWREDAADPHRRRSPLLYSRHTPSDFDVSVSVCRAP